MIIVSDTTPLRYLIEIEAAEVLGQLFGEVIIPQAVADELQHAKTPVLIKNWIQSPPAWLTVRQADLSLFTPQKHIGKGEQEAIALALELKVAVVLMDDRGATQEAERAGLFTLPTILLLEEAAKQELIDLPQVFARIRQTRFYAAPHLYEDALERDRQRRRVQRLGDRHHRARPRHPRAGAGRGVGRIGKMIG